MCVGLLNREVYIMATYQDLQRLARMLMGQGGPNPYMGLGLRDRAREGWDNFAQQFLPQAPGMQKELFQEWYTNDSEDKYEVFKKYYNL